MPAHPFMSTLVTPSRRWSLPLLLLGGILFFVVLHQSFWNPESATAGYLPRFRNPQSSGTCAANLTLLRDHGLVKPDQKAVKYARINLKPSFGSSQRNDLRVQKLNIDIPDLRNVPLYAPTDDANASLKNAETNIPASTGSPILPPLPKKRPDASHILFGVATTVKRLNDSLEAFSYWSSGNGARIHAVVEPAEGIQETLDRAGSMNIKLEISESTDKMDDRYFSHIKLFQSLKQPHTEWMAFIDDDTFFMSMVALLRMLDQYDSSKSQYIGGLSENSDQIASWGVWAFGGAGVFLSTPLMDELNEVYDTCFAVGFTADWRISQCIYQHTTTKLSWEKGLHQMDLALDQSGFYESGRELPQSIHHWKSWIHLDVVAMTAVAAICGAECVLKRFQLHDGWILTNGFSIVRHSNGWAGDDKSIEKTWESWDPEHSGGNGAMSFLHSLGPLRRRDEDKQSYRLRGVTTESDGSVRQFYVAYSSNLDPGSIVEVCWQAH